MTTSDIILQIRSDGFELFTAVVQQVNFPPDYTPAQLKQDLLTYINGNADYFMVTNFTFLFFKISLTMHTFVTNKDTTLIIHFFCTGIT